MNKSNYSLYLAGLLGEAAGENPGEAVSYRDPRFVAWMRDFERRFPTNMPSLSREDMKNLYLGRIINVLDEFGETSKWAEYAGSPDLDATVSNYEKLIDRLVRTYHSGMYQAYWDYHNLSN